MDMSSQCSVICPGSLSITETSSRSLPWCCQLTVSPSAWGCPPATSRSSYRYIPLEPWTCQRGGEGMRVWDVNLTHSHKIKMTALFTVLRKISFLQLIIPPTISLCPCICNHILFPTQCHHKHTSAHSCQAAVLQSCGLCKPLLPH